MKKYILHISLLLVVTLVFSACRTNKFNTTKVMNKDFTQYRTYGWLPPIDSLSKDYFSNDIARENIMIAANTEIEKLGLTYSKENPDILFRYVAIVNNKSRLIWSNPGWGGWGMGPWGWGMGWGGGWSQPVGREGYRYAHIIVEAFDRQADAVVWQARGSREVRNPERAINRLPTILRGIFKQYPVRK
ncbi:MULTISPECIES: DUF4136 domain-containing protein [Sphingobacterium]|uniref:DUF4136 domain-containing protein n=1 Tax=Sphingobacterium populi TaxID=1812824 RepID=A0ABW5UEJ5_9SPHI|nr:DUF4136 domain-containing protein [Sphingobacterium sp. CFCC 11742]